jgi:IS5 family transposase
VSTILHVRHQLERHGLTQAIFVEVNAHHVDKGNSLRSGTLVDATIIDSPSSTKNKAGGPNPEMSKTSKGNDWQPGMKDQFGVDLASGVTHSSETSTARQHDSQAWDDLLHCKETSALADVGYVTAEQEAALKGRGKVWGMMFKAPKGGKPHPRDAPINRIIKRQSGHVRPGTGVILRIAHSTSRCSRLATCSSSGERSWYEEQSA